jgi:hypothetical protein
VRPQTRDYASATASGGALSTRQRILLARPAIDRLVRHLAGCGAYLSGRRGEAQPGLGALQPPASAWADAAMDTASKTLSSGFLRHSLRSWLYGTALARADQRDVDPELLYVTSLLHDVGLFETSRGRCFTAAGADIAQATAAVAGVSRERAGLAAEAISAHIEIATPKDNLTKYLQQGTLLDVIGFRLHVLDPDVLAAGECRWSRRGFLPEVLDEWRKECRRFPPGRANYARRFGFTLAMHTSPLP